MNRKEFSDDVRQQADIIRVVSDYVALKKRGANWIACCPFHSEKTPSFSVHPGKGIYKCFGCGLGGSVFDFVMQIEGCAFPEAVRIVAQRSGIPIPDDKDFTGAAPPREEGRKKRVLELNEWACEFFEAQLGLGQDGKAALAYIDERGIESPARQQLRLGYAPNSWDALSTHLASLGASRDEIAHSGLVTIKEGGEGRYYDRFRGRLMFPIMDMQGRVIAFGGRRLSENNDEGPKYLNSPETAAYVKGKQLYGLNLAREPIRRAGFAVLVEGYMDFAIPYQAGVTNIVASLGTALTEQQCRLLRRYMAKPKVIVNFDADTAGQEATRRSFELLLSQGFSINVLTLPEAKDPDGFVRANGGEAYLAALKSSSPYLDYLVDQALARHDLNRPAGKADALNEVLPFVAQVPDRIERVEYAERVARRFGIDDELFRKELRRAASLREPKVRRDRLAPPKEMTVLERRFLVVLFADAGVRSSVLPSLVNEDIEGLASEAIFRAMREMHVEGVDVGYAAISERLSDGERFLLASLVSIEPDDIVTERGGTWDEALRKEAQACLVQLRRTRYERELSTVQREIQKREAATGEPSLELSLRKVELGRLIAALNQNQ